MADNKTPAITSKWEAVCDAGQDIELPLGGQINGFKGYHYDEMIKRLNNVDKGEIDSVGYLLRKLWKRHESGFVMHETNVYSSQHEQSQKANKDEFEKKYKKKEIGFRKNESGVWGVYSDLLYDTYQKDWSKAYQLTFHYFFRNMDYLSNYMDNEFFSYVHSDVRFFAFGKKCQFGEVIIKESDNLIGSKAKLDEIHGLPNHSKAPLYDIIYVVLGSKGRSAKDREQFRHGYGYWLSSVDAFSADFPKLLSSEVFAHMASTAVVNPKAFEAMKERLSNSYEMFIDILRVMALCLEKHEVDMSRREQSKAQDITERFIYILKQSCEETKELKSIKDMITDHRATDFVSDQILYAKLKEKLKKLDENDMKLVLSFENTKELKRTAYTFRNFYEKVKPNGPWDLKNTEFVNTKDKENKVIISGKLYNVDVTGNVLFGYTGSALGFSKEILLKMAGLAQKNEDIKKNGKPNYTSDSYWDDPRDQEQIEAGIALYKYVVEYKTELNAEFLDRVFSEFNSKKKW